MNISCDIIRDILPLYAEDMVSDATKEMVEEHIAVCDGCVKELETLRKGSVAMEAGARALNRVKHGIRRRRLLAVLAVFLFAATLLTGGALLLDAQIFMSADEAVKEVIVVGDTVKIVWDDRVIGTSAQTNMQDDGNYTVTAWSNLMRIIKPSERIPYEMLDDEVKQYLSREEYDSMDTTSTFSQEASSAIKNFWYCNPANGSIKLILDSGNPYTGVTGFQDGYRIKAYVLGMAILCAVCITAGILLRNRWFGQLIIRLAILAGSCTLSAMIVTAGQLVDIHERFTEMLGDSTVVVLPMALCGMCIFELIKLNRQDKGL